MVLRWEEALDAEPMTFGQLIREFDITFIDPTPPGYRIRWEDDIPVLEPKRGPLNFLRRRRWERRELI